MIEGFRYGCRLGTFSTELNWLIFRLLVSLLANLLPLKTLNYWNFNFGADEFLFSIAPSGTLLLSVLVLKLRSK